MVCRRRLLLELFVPPKGPPSLFRGWGPPFSPCWEHPSPPRGGGGILTSSLFSRGPPLVGGPHPWVGSPPRCLLIYRAPPLVVKPPQTRGVPKKPGGAQNPGFPRSLQTFLGGEENPPLPCKTCECTHHQEVKKKFLGAFKPPPGPKKA